MAGKRGSPLRSATDRSLSRGQQMMSRIKSLEGQSWQKLPANLIVIECLKSHSALRLAHRCVLEFASDILTEQIIAEQQSALAESREDRGSLKLDVASEVLDTILESLYKGKPIKITNENAPHILAAASKYGLDDVRRQVVRYLNGNLRYSFDEFLAVFDNVSTATFIGLVNEVFEELAFDARSRERLLGRMQEWDLTQSDEVKPQVVAELQQKLSTITSTPFGIGASVKRLPSAHGTFCIQQRHKLHWWKLHDNRLDEFPVSKVSPHRVCAVINDDLLVIEDDSLCAYDRNSGEQLRQHSGLEGVSQYVRMFSGQLFVSTSYRVFAIDAERCRLTKVADVGGNSKLDDFVVAGRDDNRVSLIVSDFVNIGVCRLEFVDGVFIEHKELGSTKPDGMELIGASNDWLCFCVPTFDYNNGDYVIIRNNQVLRKGKFDSFVEDRCVYEGKLYAIQKDRQDRKKAWVKCIDLATSEVIFNESVTRGHDLRLLPMVILATEAASNSADPDKSKVS